MNDSTIAMLVIIFLSLLGLSLMSLVSASRIKARAKEMLVTVGADMADQSALIEILRQDLASLCAGSVGSDARLARMDHRMGRLTERQDRVEHQVERDRPYGEAIQLVHDGATVDDLMHTLGLTPNEAELIVTMHQVEGAA